MTEQGRLSPRLAQTVVALVRALTVICGALSLITAYKLFGVDAPYFPGWFRPLFGLAAVALVGGSLYLSSRFQRRQRELSWVTGRRAWVLAFTPALTVLLCTSLHGFAPFRPDLIPYWGGLSPIFKLNLILAALGFSASLAAGILYVRGARLAAMLVLLAVGALLLIPNDDCQNPFNAWWLWAVGASPLMFVPVTYAILFSLGALLNVSFRFCVLALIAIGVGTLGLGIGHMTGLIW